MRNVGNNPNVYIVAGPNGAGKTTFARQFLPLYAKCQNFVNADLIAQGLAPFAPESAAIKAGRILLEQIQSLVSQRVDFSFESTLSGKTYMAFLRNVKSKGYVVHIFFCGSRTLIWPWRVFRKELPTAATTFLPRMSDVVL